MNNLFCLAIVLVAYAPISALAQTELQNMACVVKTGSVCELNSYSGVAKVWNKNGNQYITYTIQTPDNPTTVFNNVHMYMAGGVGNATYTCQGNGTQVVIKYASFFDSTKPCPTSLQSFVRVLGKYPSPILGGNTCQQYCYESESGTPFVAIKIPRKDVCYKDRCKEVMAYLTNNNFVDDKVVSQCSYCSQSDSAYLELRNKDFGDVYSSLLASVLKYVFDLLL